MYGIIETDLLLFSSPVNCWTYHSYDVLFSVSKNVPVCHCPYLHQILTDFKNFQRLTAKRKDWTLSWKRFEKQEAPTKGMRAPDRSTRTEENVTTVDELVGLLSQEDQTQTHRSTRQISRETGLTQSSIIQIVQAVFFVYQHACCLLLLVLLTFIFHQVE